jgi:hypothetical protein
MSFFALRSRPRARRSQQAGRNIWQAVRRKNAIKTTAAPHESSVPDKDPRERHARRGDLGGFLNLLHAESPAVLLAEAHRILAPDGRLAVTHWNPDSATPRDPAMDIRQRPENCRRWMQECGFSVESGVIYLPPWHFGRAAESMEEEGVAASTPPRFYGPPMACQSLWKSWTNWLKSRHSSHA